MKFITLFEDFYRKFFNEINSSLAGPIYTIKLGHLKIRITITQNWGKDGKFV